MTTVGDVMSRNLLTIEQETTLVDAAAAMTQRRVGAALIVSGGRLTGILTERDVLRAVAQGEVEGTSVAAWMTRDPQTVAVGDAGREAAATMIRGGFRHLPVLEGGRPVGIVSIRDLMRLVVDDG